MFVTNDPVQGLQPLGKTEVHGYQSGGPQIVFVLALTVGLVGMMYLINHKHKTLRTAGKGQLTSEMSERIRRILFMTLPKSTVTSPGSSTPNSAEFCTSCSLVAHAISAYSTQKQTWMETGREVEGGGVGCGWVGGWVGRGVIVGGSGVWVWVRRGGN